MTYALGVIAGLVFGGIMGQLKNLFIWRRYLRESASEHAGPENLGSLYTRSFISYAVNLLVLAAAFFSRDILPFNGIAFLVGTAVALATMNKVLAFEHKRQERKGKEREQ